MKDKISKIILDFDSRESRHRGTGWYANMLADEISDLFADCDAVCDCPCCMAVDRLKNDDAYMAWNCGA